MQTTVKKKICLIGAFAVGKTSLVQRYVYSIFSKKYHTTVGVKIDKKPLTLNGRSMDLIIWDIHGEDNFQTVSMSYLRGASGFFYVADGTRPATVDTVLKLRRRAEEAIGPIPSILAINKCDLSGEWEIDTQIQVRLTADNFFVVHTSAKTGERVEAAFRHLADGIMEADR
jgi:small GTP-binding protein